MANHTKQRGVDSSGIAFYKNSSYYVNKADYSIDRLLNKTNPPSDRVILGHSRLITNGTSDNQPVVKNDMCLLHNGIIVNEDEAWSKISQTREGNISREGALELIRDENRSRYQNIKWYLSVLDLDFNEVMHTASEIPKIYKQGHK
ncbi:MAG: hypothetical protein ACLFOC_10580 [Campylobacterales bacterium]